MQIGTVQMGTDGMVAKQRGLFDVESESSSPAQTQSAGLFVDVALNIAADELFTYHVSPGLAGAIAPGMRVLVPFGRRRRPQPAYVLRVHREAPPYACKAVAGVLDEEPLLDEGMLELARLMADYYCCPIGQVLEAMLPAGVRTGTGLRPVRMLSLAGNDPVPTEGLTRKQRRIVEILAECGGPVRERDVLRRAGCGRSPLKRLLERGIVRMTIRQELVGAGAPAPCQHERSTDRVALTADQEAALREILAGIEAGKHQVFLLYGVTGSGKTEVYLRAIERVVAAGRQAIVLVPEISLTPQTQERFERRFGPVAVLHSHLSPLQRHIEWRRIKSGEVSVVIGARSAVFAPCPRPGLIVIDEEHETSFKQETAPRYHARTVAIFRAQALGIPVVLGSATPSLESWARAVSGQYRLLRLPHRIHRKPLPIVRVIDLRHEKLDPRQLLPMSITLRNAIQRALAARGQVLLFLNRRGFATVVQCRSCGYVATCDYCDTSLVYHRWLDTLLCHTCDNMVPPMSRCPQCESEAFHFRGTGTERLEEAIRRLFPEARVARMDADTMRRRGAHQDTLERFRKHEIDILLGTQMITKGLDFPNVVLVGVVNADIALHLPDFRAAERTFQLVAQVAGRTGRGSRSGSVIVQTYQPDNVAIQCASRHDFEGFAEQELIVRRRHGYPPFGRLVRVVCRGVQEKLVRQTAEGIADGLRRQLGTHAGYRVMGPAPAPLFRVRGEYRHHLQLIGPPSSWLARIVKPVVDELDVPSGVHVVVDVDPINLL